MSHLGPSHSEKCPILSSSGPEIGPVSRHSEPWVPSVSLPGSGQLSLLPAGAGHRHVQAAEAPGGC